MDFKGNVKKKLAENEKKKNQSGCNSNNLASFSALEEDVIRITAIDRAVAGVKAHTFGVLTENNPIDKNVDLPHTSKSVIGKRRSSRSSRLSGFDLSLSILLFILLNSSCTNIYNAIIVCLLIFLKKISCILTAES